MVGDGDGDGYGDGNGDSDGDSDGNDDGDGDGDGDRSNASGKWALSDNHTKLSHKILKFSILIT